MASMASMAVCYSLATLSSTKPLLSHKKTTSIANLKSHGRNLQSSLVGAKLAISKTTRPLSSRRLGTSSSEVTCSTSASPLPSLFSSIAMACLSIQRRMATAFLIMKLSKRMTAYFNKMGWPKNAPKSEEERKAFVASLHKRKTELFAALIEKRLLPLRPGVVKLIDQALAEGVKVAVCSTSVEKAVC